jgi:hypothetical protein
LSVTSVWYVTVRFFANQYDGIALPFCTILPNLVVKQASSDIREPEPFIECC